MAILRYKIFLVDIHAQKNLHVRGLAHERSHPCCVGVTPSHRHSDPQALLCTCVRGSWGNRHEDFHSSVCGSPCPWRRPTHTACSRQRCAHASIVAGESDARTVTAPSSSRAESLTTLSNPRFDFVCFSPRPTTLKRAAGWSRLSTVPSAAAHWGVATSDLSSF